MKLLLVEAQTVITSISLTTSHVAYFKIRCDLTKIVNLRTKIPSNFEQNFWLFGKNCFAQLPQIFLSFYARTVTIAIDFAFYRC